MMVEINEYLLLMVLLVISISIVGFVVGFYYFSIRTKAQFEKAHKDSFKLASEKLDIEKRKEDLILAKELKEDNKRLALDVKTAMIGHVDIVINTLKSDLELHKTILLSELNMVRNSQTKLEKTLMIHKENQNDINQRLQKSLDMINQFTWGIDAKSIPPYVTGEEETQAHKDKPPEGIFGSPDSTKTKDKKSNQ